jgi:2'-5' RNA ligase
MHGLVSLLPQPYYERVNRLWKELEEECGLVGMKTTPYPHFSWQIAQDYDLERLESIMREIAKDTEPLQAQTTGLGIFSGPRPVIFIPLVKTRNLLDFHSIVWDKAQEAGHDLSPYYSPQAWMPHISLAYGDVGRSNIAAVMEKLAFQTFDWEMTIDNIALIYEPTGSTGDLRYHFKFSRSR